MATDEQWGRVYATQKARIDELEAENAILTRALRLACTTLERYNEACPWCDFDEHSCKRFAKDEPFTVGDCYDCAVEHFIEKAKEIEGAKGGGQGE